MFMSNQAFVFRGASSPSEGDRGLSLLLEIGVWDEFALNGLLSDGDHTDATTGRGVVIAGERNGVLDELSRLVSSHVRTVVIISVALDECTSRASNGAIHSVHETCRVDIVDLVTFIGVPARAEHVGGKVAIVDDSLQNRGSRAD
jgi:hypothetical protein